MTSVLQYRDPMSYRSYDPMHQANFASPQMASLKRSPPYEGHSSGSDSKRGNSTPTTKRRPSRAGTRSVTTLTKEQLERKRANDREAQRAIRQRTKDHIADLEQQIQELTIQVDASSSSARITELMRRNEHLEADNADLRARLAHYEAIVNSQSQGNGIPTDPNGIMSAVGGAPSPSDRVQMLSQPRRSPTSTPRNVHSVPDISTPTSQPGHWQQQQHQVHPYPPNVSSPHGQGSPHLNNVQAQQDAVRWSPQSHPSQPHHPVSVPVQDQGLHAIDSAGMPYPSNYLVDNNGRALSYPLENQQLVTSQPMHMTGGYNTPTSAHSPHPSDYQRPMSMPLNPHTSAPHPQHPLHQPQHHPQQQTPQTPYSTYSTPTHPTFVSPASHPGEMQPMMAPHQQFQIKAEPGHIMYQQQ